MKIKVSTYIAKTLVEHGIEQVFTVTGGGAMHLNDALGHQEGLACLYQHHEQACAISAEAYARIDNKVAALCVTTGPGGTNAITGVAGAYLDSIPMLVLSGQVRYDTTSRWANVGIRSMGDQEFDIVNSVQNMTKYAEMVIDPIRVRFCLEKAIYLTKTGRPGPCWLDIPLNVQGAYEDEAELIGFDFEAYESGQTGFIDENNARKQNILNECDFYNKGEVRKEKPCKVSDDVAREIIEKIKKSDRPIINAGNGIRIASSYEEFVKLVELLGVPVVTGWNSQDLMTDTDPLYVGRAGGMGDRAGNFAVQNSDLFLSLGSRLSIRQVGYSYDTWSRASYKIVNDIDECELNKPNLKIDMKVHADVKDLIQAIIRNLAGEQLPLFKGGSGIKDKSWLETCQYWKNTYPVITKEQCIEDVLKPTNVYALVKELSEAVKEEQITVVGNGSACVVGGHAYKIKDGQRFITNSAFASMGYDLPAAIGACVAKYGMKKLKEHKLEDLILLTGDGSIQMNLQELQTIIHHKMPIKIFIINNSGYHSIRQTQIKFFEKGLVGVGDDSLDLSFPDFEKLSYAYGYPFIRIQHNTELQEKISEILRINGPAICEVMVSTDQNFEPKSAAKQLPDGTIVSPPLEDLFPFLPESEMDEMMIIERV